MPNECYICKKRKTVGGSITHRGKSKKSGGIGLQLVKNVNREFKANLQNVRVREGQTTMRVKVCTKCLRSNMVVKA